MDAAKADLAVRELLLEEAVVGLPGLVAEVDPGPVFLVGGGDELVGGLREDGRAEVDAPLRVGLDGLFLAGGRVEEEETGEVRRALVRLHVDPLAVLVEPGRAAALEDGAGVDLREGLRIDPQDLGVAVVGDADGEPELPGEVEDPARDPLGVLPQEGPLAGRDLHLVEVVPGGVAVVEADEDDVGVGLRDVVDLGAHRLCVGQVAGGGSVLAGLGGGGRVDGPDVEVLVAVLVLDEEDVLAVAAPEEAGHRALRLGGDEAGLVVRVARLLDPDVPGLASRASGRRSTSRRGRAGRRRSRDCRRRARGRGRGAGPAGPWPSSPRPSLPSRLCRRRRRGSGPTRPSGPRGPKRERAARSAAGTTDGSSVRPPCLWESAKSP